LYSHLIRPCPASQTRFLSALLLLVR
jgi:hypothetical protein